MDQLSYTYDQSGNSNKLIRVNDASGNAAGYPIGGNTIGYDINGNMVNHLDKGISNIAYNYLNLPSSITASMGNTDYVYRADGTKVRKVFGVKLRITWMGSSMRMVCYSLCRLRRVL